MKRLIIAIAVLYCFCFPAWAANDNYSAIGPAKSGDLAVLQRVLSKGADPNAKDNDGNTPLLYAIIKENTEMVDLLFKYKANVNQVNKYGISPLMVAAKVGNTDSIELLISKGAHINAMSYAGETPLARAVQNPAAFYLLIAKGANPRANNDVALFYAVRGQIDIVKYLVEHGANVNAVDKEGDTPLLNVVYSGNIDVIKFLVEHGANVNAANKKGDTPLLNAAYSADVEIIRFLVEHGANVNTVNKNGEDVLYGVIPGFSNIYPELNDDAEFKTAQFSSIKFFLDKGVNPNNRDEYLGYTLLHRAASDNDFDLVKLLLAYKANPNIQDNYGQNVIRYIIGKDSDISLQIFQLLLQNNADFNIRDKDGFTAYSIAALYEKENLLELFLKNGANPNAKNSSGTPFFVQFSVSDNARLIALFIQYGVDVHIRDKDNHTALYYADDKEEIIRLLKGAGAKY